jgi:hypothetical protein
VAADPEGAPGPWDCAPTPDIPELKELERYFDSINSFGNDEERQANLQPVVEKAKTSQARKRRRELERPVQRGPRAWNPPLLEYE